MQEQRKRTKWTADMVDRLRHMIEVEGRYTHEAAADLGVSRTQVRQACHRYKIKSPNRGVARRQPEWLIPTIRDMAARGQSMRQAADATGYSASRIGQLAKEHGIAFGKTRQGGGDFRGRTGPAQHTKAPCTGARPAALSGAVHEPPKDAAPRPHERARRPDTHPFKAAQHEQAKARRAALAQPIPEGRRVHQTPADLERQKAEFLARHGVTKCPPAYCAEVQSGERLDVPVHETTPADFWSTTAKNTLLAKKLGIQPHPLERMKHIVDGEYV